MEVKMVDAVEGGVLMPCDGSRKRGLPESSMSSHKQNETNVDDDDCRDFKEPRLGRADRYRKMIKEDAKRAEKHNKLERERMKNRKLQRLEAKKEIISKYGEGVTFFKKGECRTERGWEKFLNYDSDEEVKEYKAFWKRALKRLEENEVENLRTLDTKCAKSALRRYNKKNSTDYKLVETLGTYYGISDGFWYHCNFKAQRKSGRQPSPELFFAELVRGHRNYVRFCEKIEDCGFTARGCRQCPDFIIDPVDKCKFGCVKM